MGRVNPRNNPVMKRVIAPAPKVIVKPPPKKNPKAIKYTTTRKK